MLGDDGFGFDLDQVFGADEGFDLDHGGAGADGAEDLAVGAAGFLPPADIGYVDARAHYMCWRSTRFGKVVEDDFEGGFGL